MNVAFGMFVFICGIAIGAILRRKENCPTTLEWQIMRIQNLTARLKQSSDRLRNAVADETKK